MNDFKERDFFQYFSKQVDKFRRRIIHQITESIISKFNNKNQITNFSKVEQYFKNKFDLIINEIQTQTKEFKFNNNNVKELSIKKLTNLQLIFIMKKNITNYIEENSQI